MNNKVVVIISGGMDSTTLLYDCIANGFDVYPISFNYGQRHSKELTYAKKTCEKLGLGSRHRVISLPITDFISNSSLTGNIDVPEGHYAEDNMKLTVVPNRNMIMLSLALGYAINIDAHAVYYGAHAGDHAIYPDCRKEFVAAMQQVAKLCDFDERLIEAPYLDIDKGGILKIGKVLEVDYSLTWTCYKGGEKACGKCGSCQERLEAFKNNGIEDPIEYETREIIAKSNA